MSEMEDESGNAYESEDEGERGGQAPTASPGSMTLGELDRFLAAARDAGATDSTRIYLSCKSRQYMSDVGKVEFQKREGWPSDEWPVVISEK